MMSGFESRWIDKEQDRPAANATNTSDDELRIDKEQDKQAGV